MGRVRIKDIAQIAQVSTGTVDRVIHNRPGVSESTRNHVQKILEEYDFQPDILAGVLASGRAYSFLVCMPDIVNAHAFWKFPETGIMKAIADIEHFDIHTDYVRFNQYDPDEFTERTKDVDPYAYDGLLFAPVFSDQSALFMKKWQEAAKPVVLFNSRIKGLVPDVYIGQDAWKSGYLGGKLMSFGLNPDRDLLLINLGLKKNNYHHIIVREQGFRAYFEEHSNRVNKLVSIDVNGGDYLKLSELIDRQMEELDVAGIFVTNSRVHLVARYLAEKGIMNIRLIGYDLLEESISYLNREYIDFLISQSPEEQAYLGIRQLFNMVVLKRKATEETILPIDIVTKENIEPYLKYNLAYE